MSLRIERPGMLSSLQDGGRWGHQKEGILVNGPMDPLAHRMANLLVGNAAKETALEICMTGPEIKFEDDHLIAITGMDLSPRINGKKVKSWRPIRVRKSAVLTFDAPLGGRFAYLAIAGGFALPAVLGSTATDLKTHLGGYLGRSLQAGDLLPCAGKPEIVQAFTKRFLPKKCLIPKVRQEPPSYFSSLMVSFCSWGFQQKTADHDFLQAPWSIAPSLLPDYASPTIIQTLQGPEWNLFTPESQQAFFQEVFAVSSQSDRMGFQLQGPELRLKRPAELLSSAVSFGTVQVPASGSPIVLMADHQTTGGYPRIGQIATVDLPLLAQTLPGRKIRFQEITLPQAQQLYLEQERQLHRLKRAIHLKIYHRT